MNSDSLTIISWAANGFGLFAAHAFFTRITGIVFSLLEFIELPELYSADNNSINSLILVFFSTCPVGCSLCPKEHGNDQAGISDMSAMLKINKKTKKTKKTILAVQLKIFLFSR